MIFFGWGTKIKEWVMVDGKFLVASWSYFHFFWCPLAGKVTWILHEDKRSEDRTVTKEQLAVMYPGFETNIGMWNRVGLLFAIGGIVVLSLFV